MNETPEFKRTREFQRIVGKILVYPRRNAQISTILDAWGSLEYLSDFAKLYGIQPYFTIAKASKMIKAKGGAK